MPKVSAILLNPAFSFQFPSPLIGFALFNFLFSCQKANPNYAPSGVQTPLWLNELKITQNELPTPKVPSSMPAQPSGRILLQHSS